MVIVWDERKRRANLDEHGVDFAALDETFFLAARRVGSRDGRFMAIGRADQGRVILVVYRPLGSEALSIISARPASREERSMIDA